MRKIKIDALLISTFVTTMLYSASYPYINRMVISSIDERFVAIQQIVTCLSAIVFGQLWNKKKDMFKLFPTFCVMEPLLIVCSTIYTIATRDLVGYYILDTITMSMVTRNIMCGMNRLYTVRYKDNRDEFDNSITSVCAASTIIGSSIAMTVRLNFECLLVVAALANILDNVFYIYVYRKEVNKGEN